MEVIIDDDDDDAVRQEDDEDEYDDAIIDAPRPIGWLLTTLDDMPYSLFDSEYVSRGH